MRSIPYRQSRMWLKRIEAKWNEPSRSDHYVMALTRLVHSIFDKPDSLKSYKIRFGSAASSDLAHKTQEEIEWSMACWRAIAENPGPRPQKKA